MSYSVAASGKTRAEAVAAINAQLQEVVTGPYPQKVHEADIEQAKSAASAFINVLPEPGDGEKVTATVSGSISTYSTEAASRMVAASVNVGASIVKG